MPWPDRLKTIPATGETACLSAAARKLGQTQPTLSPHVAVIEKRLGVTLFERLGTWRSLPLVLTCWRLPARWAEALGLVAGRWSQAVGGVA